MRWVLACMVAVASLADARVIMIPPVARDCGQAPTWDAVTTCTSKFGTVTVEKTLPHAKLVKITQETSGVRGFYLFVERHGAWLLGGMYEEKGDALALESVRLGTHDVYHVEIGTTAHEEIGLEDGTTARAVIVEHAQIYCTGTGYRCSAMTTSCDVLVAGKTRWTFRGKVSWKDGALHVTGDRTHAGPMCDQSETVPLSFPDDTE
jgi:hypothetical protein